MLFHSIPYLCFLPLVIFAVRWFGAQRYWQVLLAASSCFYAWMMPSALLFLGTVVLLTYLAAIFLEACESPLWRRMILIGTIGIELAFIYLAKYKLQSMFPSASYPLGLSFYSFQATGYLVDVYRRQLPAERHLGLYALFVSFFPVVLSGPIERASSLMSQLRKPSAVLPETTRDNLLLFAAGLFKKLVIADALFRFVGPVFENPDRFNGAAMVMAIYLTRYMIYADFSGYSDMAIASAGLLGIKVRQNFRRPFFASSLIDYWRRWHISLHDWMKDYVFFSLSTTAVGRKFGIYFCLVVSFLCMGLWHDVGGSFLAVGLWHGVFISLDYATRDWRERVTQKIGISTWPLTNRVLNSFITVTFFILPPTVFFVSRSLSEAALVFRQIFSGGWAYDDVRRSIEVLAGAYLPSQRLFVQTIAFICLLEVLQIVQAKGGVRQRVATLPLALRILIYTVIVVTLAVYAQPFGERSYVYFRF